MQNCYIALEKQVYATSLVFTALYLILCTDCFRSNLPVAIGGILTKRHADAAYWCRRFCRQCGKMSTGRMHTSVDAFGRQETLPGIFDRVRSGAYEMGDAASY